MAPFIAALLKGGLGLVANAALVKGKEWIEKETGIELGDNLTSEQLTQIKQWELENEQFLIQMRHEEDRLNAEIEIAYLQDRQSARSMQSSALQQSDLFSKQFIYWYAIVMSLAVAAYIAAITFGTIPEQNVRFADTTLGFLLGTILTTVIQFFYGSSRNAQYNEQIVDSVVTAAVKKGAQNGSSR